MSLITDLIDTLRYGFAQRITCVHCNRSYGYRTHKPFSLGYALKRFRAHDAVCRQNPIVMHRDQLAVTNRLRIRTIDRMVRHAADSGNKALADELAEIALSPVVEATEQVELGEHYRNTLMRHYVRPKRG